MLLLAIPMLLTAAWLSMPGIAIAQQGGEAAAARKPLEAYLQGHATGDARYMRQAFLPTAHIEGLRDGTFVSWTSPRLTAPADLDPQTLVAEVEKVGYTATLPTPPAPEQGGGEGEPPADAELAGLRHRVIVSAVLTVPVVVLAMPTSASCRM